MLRFLFFILLAFTLYLRPAAAAAAPACVPESSLATRYFDSEDDRPSIIVYGGHAPTWLPLRLAWTEEENAGERATLILPQSHPLVRDDMASLGYNHSSLLTMERVLVQWRDTEALWHAAASPANAIVVPLLNVHQDSAFWLHHSAIVFTGAQLFTFAHRYACENDTLNPLRAVVAVPRDVERILPVGDDAEVQRIWVRDNISLASVAEYRLHLRVNLSAAQTLVPPFLLAQLPHGHAVMLGLDTVLLPPGSDDDHALVAPQLSTEADDENTIVIGRRLARRVLQAWVASSTSGQITGILPVTESSSQTEAVGYVLLGTAIVLHYLLAFWTTLLSDSFAIRLEYPQQRPPPSLRRRTLRHLVILGISGTIAHVLGGLMAGRGPAGDLGLAQALRAWAPLHWGTSLAHVLLLLAGVAAVFYGRDRGTHAWFAVMGMQLSVLTRSVVAGLALAATQSIPAFAVATGAAILILFLPSVYMSLMALLRLTRHWPKASFWDVAVAVFSLGAAAINGVALEGTFLRPLLVTVNTRYDPLLMRETTWIVLAASAFLVSWLTGHEVQRAPATSADEDGGDDDSDGSHSVPAPR